MLERRSRTQKLGIAFIRLIMLILRPTLVIAKRFKLALYRGTIPLKSIGAADWTLMDFKSPRGRYIMATNTVTLLSVIFPAARITTEAALLKNLYSIMSEQLAHFGFAEPFKTHIQPHLGTVGYERLESRAVRGSILDFQNQAWFGLSDGETNLSEMMFRINESPMSLLNMESPLCKFSELFS